MKSPDSLTPKAQRTRAALMAAARDQIGLDGVSGVNVQAICVGSGVGRTSFYNYFENGDDLVASVAQEAALSIKHQFDALHQDTPRGPDRLRQCLRMILDLAASDPDLMRLVTALAEHDVKVAALLKSEIEAELAALASLQPCRRAALGRYLAKTVTAIAHAIAHDRLPQSDIPVHVDAMMAALS